MNSLSSRLAFLYAFIAFLIAIIQSSINIYLDFKQLKHTLLLEVEHTLASATLPAAQAVFDVNSLNAQKLLDGFKSYKYWHECTLFDELNQPMAHIGKPNDKLSNTTSWVTHKLVEKPFQHFKRQLFQLPSNRPMGRLECTLNYHIALKPFADRINTQVVGTIIRTFVAFMIVFYFTHLFITKPLNQIASKLKQLNPDNKHVDITTTQLHRDTELGILVNLFNEVIKERDHAQVELVNLNHELENKVTERTQALESANQELQLLATKDSLTGTNNRRSFFEKTHSKFKVFRRYGRPQVIMMLDLDHFKKINDKWGHRIGDEVIKCCASTCLECMRETDILGRLGGEEFAILLSETEIDEAIVIAERIRSLVTVNASAINANLELTISIGAFQFNNDVNDFHEALEKADQALYKAKNKGRNRIEVT